MRSAKTLLVLVILISALPMFGAIYIKFDGVDGESKAAGHEKWIELGSLQFEGNSCAIRRLTFSTSEMPEQLRQACQSQTRFRSVMVDVDGQRHMLEDAKLAECPTARGSQFVLRLDFASCATHPPTRSIEIGALKTSSSAVAQRPNATLVGLTPASLEMTIRKATLTGNTATVTISRTYVPSLGKAIMEATAQGTKIGTIVINSAGQQWSFSKVMFSSASFPQGQDALFTFQFESMVGSAPAFQALGGN